MIFLLIFSILPYGSTGLRYGQGIRLTYADASFRGSAAGELSGASLDIVGDINGDGLDDIIISTSTQTYNNGQFGNLWIFFGKRTGWSNDATLFDSDASLMAGMYEDHADIAVSKAGDVNGDGLDDFIVGVPLNYEFGSRTGKIYLFFGRASGWTHGMKLSDSNASFMGEYADDMAGSFVSEAGDVNGDGYGDFLIGAPGNSEVDFISGECYLILGKSSGWEQDVLLSEAVPSFRGERGYSQLCMVAGAGDVNGDGYDDFLLGAPLDGEAISYSGQAYLFLGRSVAWQADTSVADADASFIGAAEQDQASTSLDGAGDLNGDGLSDIVIGAPYHDRFSGGDEGAAYVIFGRETGWQMDMSLDDANATLSGTYNNENAGRRVAGIGDVDGDGIDDLAVSAPRWGPLAGTPGRVFLLLGTDRGWRQKSDLTDAQAIFLGETMSEGPMPGMGLGGPGDANGDGFDDLLIGAPGTSNGAGKSYLVFPDLNRALGSVSSLSLYSDQAMSNIALYASMNETVYVKLRGTGGNMSRRDVTEVTVTSDASSERGFRLRLHETGTATQTFTGRLVLSNRTRPDDGWIGTSVGETVTVTSRVDTGMSASLFVTERPILARSPASINFIEDRASYHSFEVVKGIARNWTFTTDAGWLQWNASNGTIWGIPSNLDVGQRWAVVNVSDGYGNADELNVTLIVSNVAPSILSTDNASATEDVPYSNDYSSTDDGQGTITWHLTITDGWLTIDPTTGVLSGTPTNDDVGIFEVNVSVDDGNGGWDSHVFNLEVRNTGDVPFFSTRELPDATQGQSYSVIINTTDPDVGDLITYTLETEAEWLELNATTLELHGIPGSADVGMVWVNVTAVDSYGLFATGRWSLTVLNVNDPPEILTTDVTSTLEDEAYRVVYISTDQDAGDILEWHFASNASWLSFDPTSGTLSGMPTNDDVGIYWVNVTITDLMGANATHNFTLRVLNVNDPPQIESLSPPTTVRALEQYSYRVVASDMDVGDPLSFSLVTRPDGMDVNSTTGLIEWIPSEVQVGVHPVIVQVSDGEVAVRQYINVTVTSPVPNTRPKIDSTAPKDSISVNGTFSYQVVATDAEDQSSLLFELVKGPTGMRINATTGLLTWTPGPNDVGTHQATVRASDPHGAFQEQNFTVTVKPTDQGGDGHEVEGGFPWYLVALLVVVLAVVLAVAYRRMAVVAVKGTGTVIEDVFLVYRDGRLIHHRARRPGDKGTSGMLETVQRLVRDSSGREEARVVNEVRYGDGRVLLEHGETVCLALFVRGAPSDELHARMREAVEEIEMELFPALSGWDGDQSSLKGVAKHIERFVTFTDEERPVMKGPAVVEKGAPKAVVVEIPTPPPLAVGPTHASQTKETPAPEVLPPPPAPSYQPPPPPPSPPPPKTIVPPPSPPTQASPMNEAEQVRAREDREVMKVLTQLPHGLPTSLWGWDMSELARAIVDGERRKATDGTPLVSIKGRWYVADISNLGSFLRDWDEGGAGTPEERRKKLKQLEKALLDGKISEKTYQELKRKYEMG